MARAYDRGFVNLHGHQNCRLVSDRARTVSAPAASGCDAAHAGQEIRVAYSADYLFFGAK